jgi:hypothetical protein
MSLLVKFDGIRGDKINKKDPGWFEFDSISYANPGTTESGHLPGPQREAMPSDVVLVGRQYLPELQKRSVAGPRIAKVAIDQVISKNRWVRTILKDVDVVSFSGTSLAARDRDVAWSYKLDPGKISFVQHFE